MTSELTILDEQIAAREAELATLRRQRAAHHFGERAAGVAMVIATELGTYADQILGNSKRPMAVLGRYLLAIAIQVELAMSARRVAKLIQKDRSTLSKMLPKIHHAVETSPQLSYILERARTEVRKAWGLAETTGDDQ